MMSRLAIVAVVALSPFVSSVRGENDPHLKGYAAPEGVQIEIVAEEPAVVNPSALAFGDDGTAYVLERGNGSGGEKKHTKDVVKVLRDTKGKGVYDSARVLLEEDSIANLLPLDDWLYLCGGGTVRRYRLSALGQKPKAEILVKGFGGLSHHQVSGLSLGPDGWLYLSVGAGDHRVEGSDGSRATVLRSGAIFRCRRDGSRVETFALGFCNPYRDLAFDAFGNAFHADNDGADEKLGGCRLLHVAEGCDFGWRQRPGGRGDRADLFRTAVKGELPGKMPPLRNLGRGAVSGLTIYDDTRFPQRYRGRLYSPDVVRRSIRASAVEAKGATFAATDEFTFLKSDDPLFRPCQVTTGPDGAMYVVDWRSDPNAAGDGKHGRIYRLSWSGTKDEAALPLLPRDSWLKVVRQSDDGLLQTLGDENATHRERARRELTRRGERNRSALLQLLDDSELPLRRRSVVLAVLESLWNHEVEKAFQRVLANEETPLRCLAADALGRNAASGSVRVHESLLKALSDNDVSVRRAVGLALGRVAAPGAVEALVNALAFDDSDDLYLHDGLIRALERLGKPGVERLLALAESGVKKDTERVVEIFAALRSRAAYDGLPALLKYPHLTTPQRVKLIRSCGNYLLDPPISLAPLAAYLAAPAAQTDEIQRAGAELLAARPDALAPKKNDE
jgi:quinoprotein glucose dehydrogenase